MNNQSEIILNNQSQRLVYIDNLRLVMITMVVMLHLAVTYSGFGSWYYKEGAELDISSSVLFGYPMGYTHSYFMAFLFLLAGYFSASAYDRKGFALFMKDRLVRLGIPTLFFMLAIHPFTEYFLLGFQWPGTLPAFSDYYVWHISSLRFIEATGPLWFAFALLIFSGIYALIRRLKGDPLQNRMPEGIRKSGIAILIALIAACLFLVRLSQPVGSSFINFQLSYFPMHIALFITGVFAWRNGWFSSLKNRYGLRGLAALMIGSFIPWSAIMIGGGIMDGIHGYVGGMNWPSAAYALWEATVCVGMAVLLIPFFRDRLNKQNRLVKILSDSSFSVYVFHTPIIVYLSLLMRGVELPPLMKFLLLTVIALPACFAFSHFFARRIPLLKRVL